jgi:hypothetical protein
MGRRRDDDMGMITDQVHVHRDIHRRPAHYGDIKVVAAQRGADFLPALPIISTFRIIPTMSRWRLPKLCSAT